MSEAGAAGRGAAGGAAGRGAAGGAAGRGAAGERPKRILFVCLGNICRSPTAEGVMRAMLAREQPPLELTVDSAGTGSWHVGSAPDPRASAAALARGIELAGTARQVTARDFEEFDLIVAMDRSNRDDLLAMAPDPGARAKVRLLREFEPPPPAGATGGGLDVPDPYYDQGPRGFERVLEIVEASCRGLIEEIQAAAPAGV